MGFLNPFVFAALFGVILMPFPAFEAEFFMAAFVGLAVVVGVLLWRPDCTLPRAAFLIPGAALFTLALLSVFFSVSMLTSFIYFCFFLVMPLAGIASYILTAPHQNENGALLFHMAFIGVATLFGVSILHLLFMPQYLFYGAIVWPFADPNALAGFCGMSIFYFAGHAAASADRKRLILSILAVFALLMLILCTGSRAALAAVSLSGLLFVVLAGGNRKNIGFGVLLLSIFAAAFMLLADEQSAGFIGRFEWAPQAVAKAFAERWTIWQSALAMIADYPLIGTGIGTFFLMYPAYRGADFQSAGLMAHSDPLQMAAEMGVAAPVLFYLFWAGFALYALRFFMRSAQPSAFRIQMAGLFCGLVVMVMQAHVSFMFYVLPALFLGGVMLGAFMRQTEVIEPAPVPSREMRFYASAILAILTFVFAAFQGSEIVLSRAQKRIEESNMAAFSGSVNLANAMAQQMNARAYVMAASVPLAALESELIAPEARQALYDEAWGLLDHAEKLNGRLPSIPYTRARLSAAAGVDAPDLWARRALALDPMHLASRLLLAEILQKKGSPAKALEILEQGLVWPYYHQDPSMLYEATAVLALALGRRDVTERALLKLQERKT